MADISTIEKLAMSLKAVGASADVVYALVPASKARQMVIDMQCKIIAAQTTLFALQRQYLSMADQIRALEEEIDLMKRSAIPSNVTFLRTRKPE